MLYNIYQISLTRQEIDTLNLVGWDVAQKRYPKIAAYLNSMHFPTLDKIENAFSFYEKVAKIEASDLNQVFEFGNVGPEDAIERLAPMHSVSVGDLIEDENGAFHFVASFGFEPVQLSNPISSWTAEDEYERQLSKSRDYGPPDS